MNRSSESSTGKGGYMRELSKIVNKKGVYTVITQSENYLAVSQEIIRILNLMESKNKLVLKLNFAE